MRIHSPAFNKYDKKERFIILFFHSDKLKRKAERVEAKQKASEEKNDRSCCCTICPQIILKPIRLLNKKDVYQHQIPKNLLLTHLFLLETRSRTRTRFVASNSWLKDWPRKRWIFYAVTNSVRNLDPADQQKPNVMCSQLRDSPHHPPPTPRFPSDLKSVHFFWLRIQTRNKI